MAIQLRLYTVKAGRFGAFVEAWLAGVPRLRRMHGFTIEGPWLARDENRFVWLLSYPGGIEAFKAADERYYVSAERAALSPDPAAELDQVENYFVDELHVPPG
jgi:hypothetical protein